MITGLRFVWDSVPAPELGKDISRRVKVLEYSDGHYWHRVPLEEFDTPTNIDGE